MGAPWIALTLMSGFLTLSRAGLDPATEAGGHLIGIVRWSDGGDLTMLEFALESASGKFRAGGNINRDVYVMKVRDVTPGSYTLVGRIQRTGQEFLRLEEIVIHPGEWRTDPRLQPLDLSSFLDVVTVAPRAPDGTVPPGCMVWRLRTNGGGGTNLHHPDGIQRLPVLPGGTADLLIETPGFRSVHLPQASGHLAPVLEPAFSVSIQLRGSGPIANENGRYTLRFEPAADSGWPEIVRRHSQREAALGPERGMRRSVPVLGKWSVSLLVPRVGASGNPYPDVQLLGHIEIGAGDADRVFTFELPAALR